MRTLTELMGCGLAMVLVAACSEPAAKGAGQPAPSEPSGLAQGNDEQPNSSPVARKELYFGDLHVHSRHSYAAYVLGAGASPHDVYGFAKGEPLTRLTGQVAQEGAPLDFMAVTHQASDLGMLQHPSDAWRSTVDAAERHNDPGRFTTFVGYEFAARGNQEQYLTRNVIFRDTSVPRHPFGELDADNKPEQLWRWMDAQRDLGIESMAIPHGSSGSDGLLVEVVERARTPISREFAIVRMRNEPLAGIAQARDVRKAYLEGMKLARDGLNPYQFGLISASDNHADKASDAWAASGLTGVWAEANTREALFRAMQRKETFATTGPRIRVRFFAGYDLPAGSTQALNEATPRPVPMGGDLLTAGKNATPSFAVSAQMDPLSKRLQRIQIIRGRFEDGEGVETAYDVACAGGALVGSDHRCPANPGKADINDCSTRADGGAPELHARWQDPDFKPGQAAFYYVRVLEEPSCASLARSDDSTGRQLSPAVAEVQQQSAWSSPIWLHPVSAR